MTAMVTVLVLVVLVAAVVSLAVIGLVREQRQAAERVQRRAFVRWQQRQAERQVQQITQAAFDAMLTEARSPRHGQDRS